MATQNRIPRPLAAADGPERSAGIRPSAIDLLVACQTAAGEIPMWRAGGAASITPEGLPPLSPGNDHELRVHGVAGTTPESMLGLVARLQATGNAGIRGGDPSDTPRGDTGADTVCIADPAPGDVSIWEPPPVDENLRAFSLANLAGWMIVGPSPLGRRWQIGWRRSLSARLACLSPACMWSPRRSSSPTLRSSNGCGGPSPSGRSPRLRGKGQGRSDPSAQEPAKLTGTNPVQIPPDTAPDGTPSTNRHVSAPTRISAPGRTPFVNNCRRKPLPGGQATGWSVLARQRRPDDRGGVGAARVITAGSSRWLIPTCGRGAGETQASVVWPWSRPVRVRA